MSLIAIVLVIVSAMIHALWNLLSKSKHPTSAFFLITSAGGGVIFLPFLVRHYRMFVFVPKPVWVLVIGTGFFMALYYAALAGSYRSGNLSVAYPLARSMPLVMVPAVAFILGRGEQISLLCLAGIVFIIAGSLLLPMHRISQFRLNNYANATCGLALLAAVGTAGYSVIDDQALRLLRGASLPGLSVLQTTLFYAGLETLSSTAWQAAGVLFAPKGREALGKEIKTNLGHALLAGLMIWSCYGLILLSMAFVRDVSYVAAFRQLSIPLGAALGILVLKEPVYRPKVFGIVIISFGLLLIALG